MRASLLLFCLFLSSLIGAQQPVPMRPIYGSGYPPERPVIARAIFQTEMPVSVLPGQTFECTFVVRNIGDQTWDSRWRLAYIGNGDFGVVGIPVTGTVAPGAKALFHAKLTAPTRLGTCYLTFCLMDPKGNKYNNPTELTYVVVTEDAAQFVSQKVPEKVQAGSEFYVQHTFRNTGRTTWTSEEDFNLREPNSTLRHYFPGHPAIKPGETVTITSKLKAPLSLGPFPVRLLLAHLGFFFGDMSPITMVTAVPGPDLALFLKQAVTSPGKSSPEGFHVTGNTVALEVTMKNAGRQTWGADYVLVARDDHDRTIVSLPSPEVKPGEEHVFTAAFPSKFTGHLYVRFTMEHKGVAISEDSPWLHLYR